MNNTVAVKGVSPFQSRNWSKLWSRYTQFSKESITDARELYQCSSWKLLTCTAT